jgi:hypothetical protein
MIKFLRVISAMFSARKKDKNEGKPEDKTPKITMTTAKSSVGFILNGSGVVNIDWGDGKKDTHTLSTFFSCTHNYSGSSEHIISMSGNITYLYCVDNQLTNIDASNNTLLEGLECFRNQLTSLNASGCIALEYLVCNYNQLTTLDLSGCIALSNLLCDENKLINLNLSDCTKLTKLDCRKNIYRQ